MHHGVSKHWKMGDTAHDSMFVLCKMKITGMQPLCYTTWCQTINQINLYDSSFSQMHWSGLCRFCTLLLKEIRTRNAKGLQTRINLTCLTQWLYNPNIRKVSLSFDKYVQYFMLRGEKIILRAKSICMMFASAQRSLMSGSTVGLKLRKSCHSFNSVRATEVNGWFHKSIIISVYVKGVFMSHNCGW